MERDDETPVRKRGRDEGDAKSESSSTSSSSSSLSHKSKRQEFLPVDLIKDNKEDTDDSYRYHDGIGVFDFPWLKDSSVVFQVKDYLEVELDMFAVCLDVGPDQDTGMQGSLWELGFDGEGFMWSSCKIEDLESVEFVWRCVCMDKNDGDDDHQPVENQSCLRK